MTLHRATWLAQDGSSLGTVPVDARLANSAILASNGSPGTGFIPGVFYDGNGAVVLGTAATGTMTYQLRAAAFAIQLLGSFASGACILVNDGAITVNTTAAPGSNSRIDVIWIRQQAVAADGGSDVVNTPILGCTQGTAAASPSVPAIPAGAYALAQAVVTAGTTHTDTTVITQVHNWTDTSGSRVVVRNATERNLLTPFDGFPIYRLDTHTVENYDIGAAAWLRNASKLPQQDLTHQPRRLLARITTFTLADSTLIPMGMTATSTGDDGNGTGLSLTTATVTALYSGLYRIAFCFFFPAQAGGTRQATIWKNATGSPLTGGTQLAYQQALGSASAGQSVLVVCDAALSAGDTITPGVQQTSGSSYTVGSTLVGAVYMHMHRVDDI